MRLIPDNGFMRLNLGCNRLPENRKPLRAIGATKEITNNRISTGCVAHIAILPEASRKAPMARSSTMMSRVRLKFMRIISSSVSAVATERQQATGAGGHRHRVQLLGARDLAFLAGIALAFLGGVFCLVLTALAFRHAQRALASSRSHCSASLANAW